MSGSRDHCFLSQKGTHPGLKDSNPLVTRPPSPFLPRAVTIHTCLEGPVNRVAQLLQPAGPNRDSRQQGQGAVEADEVSLLGGAVQVVACTRVPNPCILGIQAFICQVLCLIFSDLHGVFANLPSPVSAELHPPERVPLADLQKSTLCARVSVPGLEPWDLGDGRLYGRLIAPITQQFFP